MCDRVRFTIVTATCLIMMGLWAAPDAVLAQQDPEALERLELLESPKTAKPAPLGPLFSASESDLAQFRGMAAYDVTSGEEIFTPGIEAEAVGEAPSVPAFSGELPIGPLEMLAVGRKLGGFMPH